MLTKYVDPATGSHWIVNGNARRISAKLGRVSMLLMMKKGSVPGTTFFSCGLRDLKHRGPNAPLRVMALIDKALRPWKGILWDSYSREARLEGGVVLFSVTIQNGDTTASLDSVPLTGA